MPRIFAGHNCPCRDALYIAAIFARLTRNTDLVVSGSADGIVCCRVYPYESRGSVQGLGILLNYSSKNTLAFEFDGGSNREILIAIKYCLPGTTCPDYSGIALENSNKGDSFAKRVISCQTMFPVVYSCTQKWRLLFYE